jgi:hypothetical protein
MLAVSSDQRRFHNRCIGHGHPNTTDRNAPSRHGSGRELTVRVSDAVGDDKHSNLAQNVGDHFRTLDTGARHGGYLRK